MNDSSRWIRRSTVLGSAFTVLLSLVSACSLETQHGYVQSADQTLSFRYPAEWQAVDLDPQSVEWVAGVDASSQPDEANLQQFVLDSPFVVAQVHPLAVGSTFRDTVTLDYLRRLALADQRDPLEGDDPSIRLLFHNTFVDEQGFEGHHMRFEFDVEDGTATEEHFAVLAPDRTRIQRVRVACSNTCFEANTAEIEALFASIRLRP